MLIFGCITAFMTAAYMTRAVWLTFFGEYRGEGHPHESPKVMTIPLWILAGMAVVTGFINIPAKLAPESFELRFEHYVEPTFAFPTVIHPEFSYAVAATSIFLALFGVFLGWRDTDPNAHVSSYGYDPLGRLRMQTMPVAPPVPTATTWAASCEP